MISLKPRKKECYVKEEEKTPVPSQSTKEIELIDGGLQLIEYIHSMLADNTDMIEAIHNTKVLTLNQKELLTAISAANNSTDQTNIPQLIKDSTAISDSLIDLSSVREQNSITELNDILSLLAQLKSILVYLKTESPK